jgi:hypothetical protein
LIADKPRNPAEIERDIEHTRDELARSIDLLAERLSPGRFARRSLNRAKEEAEHVASDISAMVRHEPVARRSPLTGPVLIGAGLVITTVAMKILFSRRGRDGL